ncbi:MAG TPA: CoA pyrophosphatase [Actinomycetota bacterium]|nr:CoA pyrophosphatase [Actinomycetota bacterium]
MPDLDDLRRRLGRPGNGSPGEPPLGQTPAAVLVPIVAGSGGWYLLLTRRTDGLSNHRGEIAFPGGRLEPGEVARDAALRETHEELGIEPADVDLLGALPGVGTNMSRFWITPWVGVVGDGSRPRIVPNRAEVAALLEVPIDALLAPGCRRDQRFIRGRRVIRSPAYDTSCGTIWGATGRIVAELLEAIV